MDPKIHTAVKELSDRMLLKLDYVLIINKMCIFLLTLLIKYGSLMLRFRDIAKNLYIWQNFVQVPSQNVPRPQSNI